MFIISTKLRSLEEMICSQQRLFFGAALLSFLFLDLCTTYSAENCTKLLGLLNSEGVEQALSDRVKAIYGLAVHSHVAKVVVPNEKLDSMIANVLAMARQKPQSFRTGFRSEFKGKSGVARANSLILEIFHKNYRSHPEIRQVILPKELVANGLLDRYFGISRGRITEKEKITLNKFLNNPNLVDEIEKNIVEYVRKEHTMPYPMALRSMPNPFASSASLTDYISAIVDSTGMQKIQPRFRTYPYKELDLDKLVEVWPQSLSKEDVGNFYSSRNPGVFKAYTSADPDSVIFIFRAKDKVGPPREPRFAVVRHVEYDEPNTPILAKSVKDFKESDKGRGPVMKEFSREELTEFLKNPNGGPPVLFAEHSQGVIKAELKLELPENIKTVPNRFRGIFGNQLTNLEGNHLVAKVDISFTGEQYQTLVSPLPALRGTKPGVKIDPSVESLARAQAYDRLRLLEAELIKSAREAESEGPALNRKIENIGMFFNVYREGITNDVRFLEVKGSTYYERTAFGGPYFDFTVDRNVRLYSKRYDDDGLIPFWKMLHSLEYTVPPDAEKIHSELKIAALDFAPPARKNGESKWVTRVDGKEQEWKGNVPMYVDWGDSMKDVMKDILKAHGGTSYRFLWQSDETVVEAMNRYMTSPANAGKFGYGFQARSEKELLSITSRLEAAGWKVTDEEIHFLAQLTINEPSRLKQLEKILDEVTAGTNSARDVIKDKARVKLDSTVTPQIALTKWMEDNQYEYYRDRHIAALSGNPTYKQAFFQRQPGQAKAWQISDQVKLFAGEPETVRELAANLAYAQIVARDLEKYPDGIIRSGEKIEDIGPWFYSQMNAYFSERADAFRGPNSAIDKARLLLNDKRYLFSLEDIVQPIDASNESSLLARLNSAQTAFSIRQAENEREMNALKSAIAKAEAVEFPEIQSANDIPFASHKYVIEKKRAFLEEYHRVRGEKLDDKDLNIANFYAEYCIQSRLCDKSKSESWQEFSSHVASGELSKLPKINGIMEEARAYYFKDHLSPEAALELAIDKKLHGVRALGSHIPGTAKSGSDKRFSWTNLLNACFRK